MASPASWHRISTALSQFLSTKFSYDTGPFENVEKSTPAKPFLVKFDYNVGTGNKISFRYSQLDSSTDKQLSSSSSAGLGRGIRRHRTGSDFQSSNYTILENNSSGVGEWNSVVGSSHVEQPHRRLHDQ